MHTTNLHQRLSDKLRIVNAKVGVEMSKDNPLANETNLLLEIIEVMSEALEEVAKATYGTEFTGASDDYENNYEIISRHFFGAQSTAKTALTKAAELVGKI